MSVIWRKVWFDLWHHRTRTLLAILSVAVGVFAIGTIFGMVDQLLTGMDSAHREVEPSHVNIILRDYVDLETVDRIRELPGVVDVDPVNQISVRYKTAPDEEWEIGTLVMRPDYDSQTYDVVVLKEGEWPRHGRIGIERLSGQYYGVAIGDEVIFEIDGEERAFEVGGNVRHPFVQPPPFGGQAHFFTDAEGLEEFGIPAGRYGQLLIRVDSYSLERAQDIAGDIRSELADLGFGVIVMLYQDPDEHWGRMFVEGITVVLQIMAAVSLFLSVVLVLTTTTAIITQQTDQIGVLKAIGGRRSTIVRVYMAGVLAYGLLALLVALPLGMLTAYGASRWFLNLFNIDYEVFQISIRALVLQMGASLIAPLIAALWPVLRGATITVREAIATYGIGGDFGSGWLDRLVERIGERLLPTPHAAALGNMFRRKERLTLTLLVLVTAGVMFLVIMTLISSTTLTLDNEMQRRGYDVRIGFTADQAEQDLLRLALETEDVRSAEVWYSRNATLLREGERLQDSAGLGAQLIGIPADTGMMRPLITAGRWLQPGDDRVVVVSQDTATTNNITVGDTITLDLGLLGSEEWQVIGTYKVIYKGGFVTEAIYAPLVAVLDSTGQEGIGTQVLVQVTDSADRSTAAISDDLKTAYEDAGLDIDFYTTAVKAEEREYLDNQFNSVVSTLLGLAMLMATVGGIGLAGSLSISVMERRREIGVMRAIGARTPSIMSIFIMEGVLQGLLSWLLAVPIAFVSSRPLARLLGQTMLEIDLDYRFNLAAVLIWLAVVLVVSVLASLGPARSATRISVRQSLAYE